MRRGTEPSKGDAPCWQTDRSSSRAITNYPIGVALERLHSWSLRTSAASAQCQPANLQLSAVWHRPWAIEVLPQLGVPLHPTVEFRLLSTI